MPCPLSPVTEPSCDSGRVQGGEVGRGLRGPGPQESDLLRATCAAPGVGTKWKAEGGGVPETAQGQPGHLGAMSLRHRVQNSTCCLHISLTTAPGLSYHGREGMTTLPNGLNLSLKSSAREIPRPLEATCSIRSPWPLSCAWSLHWENYCFLSTAPLQLWTRGHQALQGALGLLRSGYWQVGTGVDSPA